MKKLTVIFAIVLITITSVFAGGSSLRVISILQHEIAIIDQKLEKLEAKAAKSELKIEAIKNNPKNDKSEQESKIAFELRRNLSPVIVQITNLEQEKTLKLMTIERIQE